MNPINKCSITLLLVISALGSINSQTFDDYNTLSSNIIAKSRAYQDSIVLRVIPLVPIEGYELMKYGYDVHRIKLSGGMIDPNETFIKLNNNRILPATKEEISLATTQMKDSDDAQVLDRIIYPSEKDLSVIGGSENAETFRKYLQYINFSVNVLSCQDMLLADLLGLRFVDDEVVSGQEYMYRLVIYGPNDAVKGEIFTRVINTHENLSTIVINNIEESNQSINLYWDFNESSEEYFLYHIERSKDGEDWQLLNDIPYLPLFDKSIEHGSEFGSFQDSVTNYDPYYYRVYGLSYFAEHGPDGLSVKAQGIDDVPASAPSLDIPSSLNPDEIKLTWSSGLLSGTGAIDPDIRGYNVYKSPSDYGPYFKLNDELIPPLDTSYIDQWYKANTDSYYRVCSVDENDNEGCSLTHKGSYIDTIPPSIPQDLAGVVDSAGIVTLSWTPNRDEDIWGYFIYMANTPEDDYVRITGQPLTDTTFVDTLSLNTLSRKVYYKISATDIRTNFSERSDYVELNRPDTIPPTSAVFVGFEAIESGNKIQWIPSSFADVTVQEIERRSKAEPNWQVIADLSFGEYIYIDSLVQPNTRYAYRIKSIDQAGNYSYTSKDMAVKSWYRRGYEAPQGFNAIKNDDTTVSLIWDRPSQVAEAIKVYVYRGKDANDLKPYLNKSLDNNNQITDAAVQPGEVWYYKLRLRMDDKLYTAYTNTVFVKI